MSPSEPTASSSTNARSLAVGNSRAWTEARSRTPMTPRSRALYQTRPAGSVVTGFRRAPVRGCRITREPDLACVYEHRVYKSNLPGEGELPTATGHRVDAANAAVLRSRIPDDACRIHGDAMGIGAC